MLAGAAGRRGLGVARVWNGRVESLAGTLGERNARCSFGVFHIKADTDSPRRRQDRFRTQLSLAGVCAALSMRVGDPAFDERELGKAAHVPNLR